MKISLGVEPETRDLINILKKSNYQFYKTTDNLIMYALTDHLLRLQKEGSLKKLIEKNPVLKSLVAKIIYRKNGFPVNNIVFEHSSKSLPPRLRSSLNNTKPARINKNKVKMGREISPTRLIKNIPAGKIIKKKRRS